jgi:tetratricopeptide (TPR) repeat protein
MREAIMDIGALAPPAGLKDWVTRLFVILLPALTLSACQAPLESRVALSEPGEVNYDERLVGSWYGESKDYVWYLHIAPRGETPFLDILGIGVGGGSATSLGWIAAVAYASSIDGVLVYNVKRVSGVGDDYTFVKRDSPCEPTSPEVAPGFMIVRAEITETDRLKLRTMGGDISDEVGEETAKTLQESLEQHLNFVEGRYKGLTVLIPMLELSRPDLIALIRKATPEKFLANKAVFGAELNGSSLVESFRRLSREPPSFDISEVASNRISALITAAEAQVAVGDLPGALVAVNLAERTAACVSAPHSSYQINRIMEIRALAGDTEGMLKAVAAIESSEQRAALETAHRQLSIARARAGDSAGALEAAHKPESPATRFRNLMSVFFAQVEQDDMASARRTIELALEAANSIEVAQSEFEQFWLSFFWRSRTRALLSVAEAQAMLDDVAGARETVQVGLDSLSECSGHLFDVLNTQVKIGDDPGARRTIVRLRECIPLIEPKDQRVDALTRLAAVIAERGELMQATDILHQAVQAIDEPQESRGRLDEITEVLSDIAGLQTGAGARKTAELAVEYAELAGGGDPMLEAARAQARAGNLDAALEIFRSVESAQNLAKHAPVLGTIAAKLSDAGEAGQAWEMIQMAVSETEPDAFLQLTLPGKQVDFLIEVGLAMAKAGDTAGATRAFEGAIKIAERGPDPSSQLYRLLQISETQLEADDLPGAKRTAALAAEVAEQTTDPYSRVMALSQLAQALQKAGDVLQGKETAARAFEYAKLVPIR